MTRLPLVVVMLSLTSATASAASFGDPPTTLADELALDTLRSLAAGRLDADTMRELHALLGDEATRDVTAPDGASLLDRAHPSLAAPSRPLPWRAPIALADATSLLLLPDGALVSDLLGDVRPSAGAFAHRTPDAMLLGDRAPTLDALRGGAGATGAGGQYDARAADADAPTTSPSTSARAMGATTGAPPAIDGPTAAAVAGGVALAGLAALAGVALYHRIRPSAALENDTRKAIFDAVCERPGLGVHELAEAANVSYSTATYHLERLVAAGILVMTPDGNKLCYYKNGGAFSEGERKLIPILKNAEATRLLEAILESPGTYRAALAGKLGVTATTINWHLRRLREAGLIDEVREGRNAYLFPRADHLTSSLRALAPKLGPNEEPAAGRLLNLVSADGGAVASASTASGA